MKNLYNEINYTPRFRNKFKVRFSLHLTVSQCVKANIDDGIEQIHKWIYDKMKEKFKYENSLL